MMKGLMRAHTSEAGFSLMELLLSTAIGLVVVGAGLSTFKDASALNSTVTNMSDASQNVRGGINYLVKDLSRAGRLIPIGGISIPSGAGATLIGRPSPPGFVYAFDNTTQTTLSAITTGQNKGATVDGNPTDMVTILTIDPILDTCLGGPLQINPASTGTVVPVIAADGSSFSVGTSVACLPSIGGGGWLVGFPTGGQPPVAQGDLLLFTTTSGQSAIQTVTKTLGTTIYFDPAPADPFNFNQRNAAGGTITQLLVGKPILTVQRVLMYTYFVTPVSGEPHLMRQLNFGTAQALAGVVEDLQLTYDMVDGTVNPTDVTDLPVTLNGNTYTPNQIRKVNVHIGVRSETLSMKTRDYLRTHVSTVVSLRSLAFVDRYQ